MNSNEELKSLAHLQQKTLIIRNQDTATKTSKKSCR